MIRIVVQEGDFDVGAELAALPGDVPGVGAVASFIGIVRGGDGLTALTLEHYAGMTEAALRTVAEEADARWPLTGITILHRIGRLRVGDRIVLVATASGHRAAALEATAFLMDWLKTRAPFWKREEGAWGTRWVEARHADTAAAERWT
jgi:molybdopterin synthase catalytic subunit